ncbi:MAG: phosphatase PAP2 family protein [Marmoricola sp.]
MLQRAPSHLRVLNRLLRRRALVEIVIIVVLMVVYNVVRAGGGDAAADTGRRHARDIIKLEGWWFDKVELGVNHWIVGVTVVAVAACYFYALMHYVMTPVVLLVSRKRGGWKYLRGFAALVLACMFALVVYANVPVAPPRLVPGSGSVDVLSRFSSWGWWGAAASAPRGLGDATNQYAAVPSMHFGWSLWCGIQMWGFGPRRWKVLAVLYPSVQAFVVIATANHFLFDVLAGGLCTLAAFAVVTLVQRGWLRWSAARSQAVVSEGAADGELARPASA